MPDATRSQHPKPRNAVRMCCVVRAGRCRKIEQTANLLSKKPLQNYGNPNLLQSSRSTFSRGSFLSFFAFKEGMSGTPISVLGGWPTVSGRFLEEVAG